MKGKLIMTSIIIAFVVGFFVITTATANVVEINPDNDAYVKDIDPNTNYGSLAALIVGDYTSSPPVNIHRSYLMFDLGSLPSGAVINTAELYLYNSWLSYPAVDVGAHYLSNDGWNEGSITWNNAPTGFNSTATDLNTISMCEWTSWDVTPDVQATWAGDGVYSVVMKEPSADEGQDANNLGFDSKEAGAGHEHPYLRIEYTVSCCNHDGIRGDVNYDFAGPNIADLTYLVDYLFRGGPEPPCFEEGDVNGDGSINVADLTYLVDFLFRGGPPPPPCP